MSRVVQELHGFVERGGWERHQGAVSRRRGWGKVRESKRGPCRNVAARPPFAFSDFSPASPAGHRPLMPFPAAAFHKSMQLLYHTGHISVPIIDNGELTGNGRLEGLSWLPNSAGAGKPAGCVPLEERTAAARQYPSRPCRW